MAKAGTSAKSIFHSHQRTSMLISFLIGRSGTTDAAAADDEPPLASPVEAPQNSYTLSRTQVTRLCAKFSTSLA